MKTTRILNFPDIGGSCGRLVVLAAMVASANVGVTTTTADEPAGVIAEQTAATDESESTKIDAEMGWKKLIGRWDISRYGGEGPTEITGDLIKLGFGDPLTGVYWTGDYPKDNYEIRLQARRTDAFDFFAAVTFPVTPPPQPPSTSEQC